MNCKQVSTQVDKYLDNRLDDIQKKEMDIHFKSCEKCNSMLLEYNELYHYVNTEAIKIPENTIYTDVIMKKILDFQSGIDMEKQKKSNGMFFYRLGFSMVLTALIMVFSFLLPAGRFSIFETSVHAESKNSVQKQFNINDALSKIDDSIRSIINSIDFNF